MSHSLPIKYSRTPPKIRREVREQYVKEQGGLCYWCKDPLSGPPTQEVQDAYIDWRAFPPNFLKHPVHLQHDHNTDLTEGAVHARCNAYMWHYHKR
jgi:hypothetical protein